MKATKKLFALFLAFTLLFLTACNNKPADSTIGTGNPQNPVTPNELELKDMIVCNVNKGSIDLPSRIVYQKNGQIYYYSKVDGQAYVYCFDPLCNHEGLNCLANPSDPQILGWSFENTLFINNRFYTQTPYGKIVSFSFDGTDKKIEYDAGYALEMANQIGWGSNPISCGPYIYFTQRADETGEPHTLRFHVETGKFEDLTAITENYIYPYFVYNGELYGTSNDYKTWIKSDLEVKSCKEIDEIPFSSKFFGSQFFITSYDENRNAIGIRIYDMKTGESEILTNETIGIDHPAYILYVDENYIYFYQKERIYIGDRLDKDEVIPYKKENDGSIYRINHDGSGLVCIYEEAEFEITGFEAAISGNQFLVKGHNIRVHDLQVETWDNGLLVGTIGADGKIDSLDPVEVVE